MAEKHDDMNAILSAPDKHVGKTRGVEGALARLFRQILADENIKINQFENYMMDFLNAGKRKLANNSVVKMYTRGNLRRAFEKPTMTFKVLVQAVCFLKKKKLRLFAELTDRRGKVTVHMVSIDLDLGDMDDFLYSPEQADGSDWVSSRPTGMSVMREVEVQGLRHMPKPYVEGSDPYADVALFVDILKQKENDRNELAQRKTAQAKELV